MDFDFEHFLTRKKLKHKEAAAALDLSMGYIGVLASDPSKKPSYETIVKLINGGITIQELFGEELAKKLIENSGDIAANKPTTDELKASIREVMKDLIGSSVP